MHVDTDFECKRSIEPLIEDADALRRLPQARQAERRADGLGARPPAGREGAAGDQAAAHVREEDGDGRQPQGHDRPEFLDAILLDQPGVTFIDPELFYPRTPEQIENAYAVHHKARAWKDEEGLRAMLTKAEAAPAALAGRDAKWRRRAEEAEAELERLRAAARS